MTAVNGTLVGNLNPGSATNGSQVRRSRVEVDVRRLLACCEQLAQDYSPSDWRLAKYLQALDGMMVDLQKLPTKPCKDVLADYNKRHTFLKGLIQTTKLKNPIHKVVAAQHLPHSAATTETNTASKEIHQKTTAKYNKELKSELFGTDSEDTLRHRNISKPPLLSNNPNGAEDLDSVLQYHHEMQEKVAENILLLTRNLKEQSQLANKIIKKDTETLQTSTHLTESNMSLLSTEHERLKEHNSKACKCWLWVLISAVVITFLWMVVLMKVFKKKAV